MKKILHAALAAATIAASAAGQAAIVTTTIDFAEAGDIMFFEDSYTTKDYTFTVNVWEYNFRPEYGNESITMLFCGFDASSCMPGTRVTLTGAAPFSLSSLDAAAWYGKLNFAGTNSSGKTVDGSIDFSEYNWKSYAFDSLNDLTSLEMFWTGTATGAGEIDNLVLVSGTEDAPPASVPEPATLALLGAALLGMCSVRRRKA